MDFANASLLDEASSAAEAVLVAWRALKKTKSTILVSEKVFQASREVIKTCVEQLSIKVIIGDVNSNLVQKHKEDLIGVVLQTPDMEGLLHDYSQLISEVKGLGGFAIVGTDLMA